MLDVSAGNFGRPAGGAYQFMDAGGICPITANRANELPYVMPADGEDRAAGLAVELRGAKTVDVLGGVIELVLNQSHELGNTTGGAVVGIERDGEVRQ